jgi:hypothetical protein
MKHKSDAPIIRKSMIATVKSTGQFFRRIRIDNDTVLLSTEFTAIYHSEGIAVERTVPYSHWQLGRIERQWRTLTEGAKTLLLHAGLPDRFWGHAFLVMVYIRNRCWSSGSNGIAVELVT